MSLNKGVRTPMDDSAIHSSNRNTSSTINTIQCVAPNYPIQVPFNWLTMNPPTTNQNEPSPTVGLDPIEEQQGIKQ